MNHACCILAKVSKNRHLGRFQSMKSSKATVKTSPRQSMSTDLAVQSQEARSGAAALSSEDKPSAAIERKRLIIAGCSVMAVTLAVFINCLANGWVFDDFAHALDPPELRSLSNILKLLAHYRPLRDISYALDFRIWGESAMGFHFTSIVIHSVNAGLVFLLCHRLLRTLPAAVLAALIFALHPIQTDSVSYVSGRRDLLFSMFYLAALNLYLSHYRQPSKKMLWLALACWGLSLMSKEMAASFPVVVFLWNYTGEWRRVEGSWLHRFFVSARTVLKRDVWLYLGMGVVVVAYSYYDVVAQRASARASSSTF